MNTAQKALDRMIDRTGAPVLGTDEMEARVAEGDWIVMFVGDPNARVEVGDLAVILPEIVKEHDADVNIAVTKREDEDALAAVYGVFVKPSLVFIRDGEVRGVAPKIKDWATYAQLLRDYLPSAERRAIA